MILVLVLVLVRTEFVFFLFITSSNMHCNILWTFSILFFSIHPSYVHMHMFCNSYCIFECVQEYKKLSQLKILNVKNDKSQEKRRRIRRRMHKEAKKHRIGFHLVDFKTKQTCMLHCICVYIYTSRARSARDHTIHLTPEIYVVSNKFSAKRHTNAHSIITFSIIRLQLLVCLLLLVVTSRTISPNKMCVCVSAFFLLLFILSIRLVLFCSGFLLFLFCFSWFFVLWF